MLFKKNSKHVTHAHHFNEHEQFEHKDSNILEIRSISKEFDGKIILKGLNLDIKQGEFVTILGPSGCGKSTLLRMIAGFEQPSAGEIYIEGKNIRNWEPYERPINTIFQNYALFPHMNVHENIAYPLRIRKIDKDKIEQQVSEVVKLVNLEDFIYANPNDLSGGQKQRVAIARALINKPKILLLDEPLSALDNALRKNMQVELKKIQRKVGITFIFVTHDQEEALTLSDRIVVMNEGNIIQNGTPIDIYNEPESRWISSFIGESNIIEDAIFIEDEVVSFDGKKFNCVDKGFGHNQEVDIMIRPEDIDIIKATNKKTFFTGTVQNVVFIGVHWEILVKTRKRSFLVHTTDFHPEGKKVGLHWTPEDIHVMWKEIQ